MDISTVVKLLWAKITAHETPYYVHLDAENNLVCAREGTQKQLALSADPDAILIGVYISGVEYEQLLEDVGYVVSHLPRKRNHARY